MPYQKAIDVIVKALLDAQAGVKSILIKILVSRAGSHKKTPTGACTICAIVESFAFLVA